MNKKRKPDAEGIFMLPPKPVLRVTQVAYSMLRVTKQYENDRVEITVEVPANEDFDFAVQWCKAACEAALQAPKLDALAVAAKGYRP